MSPLILHSMLMSNSKNAELNSTHAIQERHGSSNSLRKENPPPFECSHFLCKFSVCLLNNAPILTKWIDLLKSLTILLDGKSCRSFFFVTCGWAWHKRKAIVSPACTGVPRASHSITKHHPPTGQLFPEGAFPGGAVVKNLPANAVDTGRSHMLRGSQGRGQLLKPTEAPVPTVCAQQQEKPPQWEASEPQRRAAPAHRSWRTPMRSDEAPPQPKNKN